VKIPLSRQSVPFPIAGFVPFGALTPTGFLIGAFARTDMIAPGCIYRADNRAEASEHQVALFRVLDFLTQQHQCDGPDRVFDTAKRHMRTGKFLPVIVVMPIIVIILPLRVSHARNNSDVDGIINRKLRTSRRHPVFLSMGGFPFAACSESSTAFPPSPSSSRSQPGFWPLPFQVRLLFSGCR